MNKFVRPETDLLTLANGDTLIVKRRLNTGETRRMFAAMHKDVVTGETRADVTGGNYDAGLVEAYLLDWTVTDDGRPVPIRGESADVVRAALENLEFDAFQEIANAIRQHVNRQAEIRADEKKTLVTAIESPAILPSPFVAVGVTNG